MVTSPHKREVIADNLVVIEQIYAVADKQEAVFLVVITNLQPESDPNPTTSSNKSTKGVKLSIQWLQQRSNRLVCKHY